MQSLNPVAGAAGLSPWGIAVGGVIALPLHAFVVLGSLLAGQSFGVCLSPSNPSRAMPFKVAGVLLFMTSLVAGPWAGMGGYSGFLPGMALGFSAITLGLWALTLAFVPKIWSWSS